MKVIIIAMGILSFLFGRKQATIQSENLYGNWEAVSLNGDLLNKHGFNSIKMEITSDTICIITQMNTFGDIKTTSEGIWKLKDQIFISKIGNEEKESHLQLDGAMLIFTPDPLFKTETVYKSEYRKVR